MVITQNVFNVGDFDNLSNKSINNSLTIVTLLSEGTILPAELPLRP